MSKLDSAPSFTGLYVDITARFVSKRFSINSVSLEKPKNVNKYSFLNMPHNNLLMHLYV